MVKKGRGSDEAFTRRVLGKLAAAAIMVVINDEAHHAYRKPAEREDQQEGRRGMGIESRGSDALDRRAGSHSQDAPHAALLRSVRDAVRADRQDQYRSGLFDWIVSDFGLNDAIEGGLVKTPRVVVRDDALPTPRHYRSKLYHIYREAEVADDLNREAEPHEALPKLVQDAYTLLGADWRETAKQWQEAGHVSPPVMLTVCNRTETAARIEHYFSKGDAHWPELHAPDADAAGGFEGAGKGRE